MSSYCTAIDLSHLRSCLIVCYYSKYKCQYKLADALDYFVDITLDIETKQQKFDVMGKIITIDTRHLQPRTQTKIGRSIKIGCKYRFMVKQLYYHRDIAEIVYHNPKHANKDSLIVHGEV